MAEVLPTPGRFAVVAAGKTDPEWGIKRLLTRNLEDLSRARLAKLWNTLIDLGDHGEPGKPSCPLKLDDPLCRRQ